jgi:choline dehydrogenase-like flavoprotein
MCTTRMSDDPRTGVVDRNCRVHGVANLYLGGSSVFATPGFVNPTYTVVQLALRLADHLSEPRTAAAHRELGQGLDQGFDQGLGQAADPRQN